MGKFIAAAPDAIHSRKSHAIDRIVIHTMQGSLAGTIATFQKAGRKVPTAAHYCIGEDGAIVQMVPDESACWHAGNMDYNLRSIGIEHAGWVDDGKPPPDAMLLASAKIVAVLCAKYGIPVDRQHIIGHVEVPRATHTDPGEEWPWARYMEMIAAAT